MSGRLMSSEGRRLLQLHVYYTITIHAYQNHLNVGCKLLKIVLYLCRSICQCCNITVSIVLYMYAIHSTIGPWCKLGT